MNPPTEAWTDEPIDRRVDSWILRPKHRQTNSLTKAYTDESIDRKVDRFATASSIIRNDTDYVDYSQWNRLLFTVVSSILAQWHRLLFLTTSSITRNYIINYSHWHSLLFALTSSIIRSTTSYIICSTTSWITRNDTVYYSKWHRGYDIRRIIDDVVADNRWCRCE